MPLPGEDDAEGRKREKEEDSALRSSSTYGTCGGGSGELRGAAPA